MGERQTNPVPNVPSNLPTLAYVLIIILALIQLCRCVRDFLHN